MRKDYLRDYSTAAFNLYGKVGNVENYKKSLVEEIEHIKASSGSGISKPTEAALIKAEEQIELKIATIRDLEAVEKTLEELKNTNIAMFNAVNDVYVKSSLKKKAIENAVIRTAKENFISERTVYYYLKKARRVFAYTRGLRIEI